VIEPDCGWEEGFQRLMAGRCPYCGLPIVAPVVSGVQRGPMFALRGQTRDCELTWACAEACNP